MAGGRDGDRDPAGRPAPLVPREPASPRGGERPDCLCAALSKDMEGMDVNTFKLWLERTRRYSFYL